MLRWICLQVEIHEDFIQSCFDRLKASYDTLCVLDGDKDSINCARQEAIRMVRVLTVLREYITECDSDYHEERTILPMSRSLACTIIKGFWFKVELSISMNCSLSFMLVFLFSEHFVGSTSPSLCDFQTKVGRWMIWTSGPTQTTPSAL